MESIVRDMRCPNCGSHALEPDKSSFGIFVCTMCGSIISAKELANWADTIQVSKLSAEEERKRRENEELLKRWEIEREEFFRNVSRYRKTENIEELQCLANYFTNVNYIEDHCCADFAYENARMCREKIKEIKECREKIKECREKNKKKIGCLSMVIAPPIILLLGYLIWGEGFFEFLGVAGAFLIICIICSSLS